MKLTTKQHDLRILEKTRTRNLEYAVAVFRGRLFVMTIGISAIFLLLVVRIFHLSLLSRDDVKLHNKESTEDFRVLRADIIDAHGEILATNITTASLYANPRELLDVYQAAKQLSQIFPMMKENSILSKLRVNKNFSWIKRHLTPQEQQKVHDLGIPGLYFINDEKRVYPHTNLFSHVLGFTGIDGGGLSGVELYFDKRLAGSPQEPLQLSLDSRVQSIVHEELEEAIQANEAIGGAGLVMHAKSGEILSMVSLPDFNPHNVDEASEEERFNKISLGTYEIGSVLKLATTASALDIGCVTVNDGFNVSAPLQVAKFKIHDYKGKGGELSVPEILMYSSNIGTGQIATLIGVKKQREYLKRFGLLDKLSIELPEVGSPQYPSLKRWNEVSLVTISYGHGIAFTPLHMAQAFASIINEGILVKPTLLKSKAEASPATDRTSRLIDPNTSLLMRKLLRLVVTSGSGRSAEVKGYFVGGKSGTAEKIIGNKYSKNANLSSFVAAYPIYDPQYLVFIMIDEAKRNEYNGGQLSGGAIASPVVGKIVKRISSVLNMTPNMNDRRVHEQLFLKYKPRYKWTKVESQ
ncbi:peptidoglycan D,D-transpeptidase FtsI family protein [Rickettsiales endosymbiont of Peranema trichophorum]|uniref:peptidoglycan D,D-transpeptidase FtsI family protein n=1 Tax=Rickettsiales endosymbiont of Peranema trichophorum TaxID=2486577 RepID=UPI001A9227EF|nr:penicillin-binding protein 2 [Rickettsiales endosymbiont of Peranema trichophorum]